MRNQFQMEITHTIQYICSLGINNCAVRLLGIFFANNGSHKHIHVCQREAHEEHRLHQAAMLCIPTYLMWCTLCDKGQTESKLRFLSVMHKRNKNVFIRGLDEFIIGDVYSISRDNLQFLLLYAHQRLCFDILLWEMIIYIIDNIYKPCKINLFLTKDFTI